MKFSRSLMIAVLAGSIPMAASAAGNNTATTLRQMQARLDELNAKVAQLEHLRPDFATMMPEVAERLSVMHSAGEAGDWAVAAHELAEIQRIVGNSTSIDQTKGKMMQGFLTGPLNAIDEAVDHGNKGKFISALGNTVNSCNACHHAVGSGFIQISLSADSNLGFRHPQQLQVRTAAMGHHHHGDESAENDAHTHAGPHGQDELVADEDHHDHQHVH